ncbi:TPA: hypothetical protein SJ233_002857 [Legionella pneumophila]|jgi:hypothetical protein|nr:hypothetical protein [Legionella pneumophila]
MPISINDVIKSADITTHYLGDANKEFKIFRHNKDVYAVRYDGAVAVDFLSLWTSNKGEGKTKKVYIGSGTFGDVYEKTENKAFKQVGDRKYKGNEIGTNLDILRQKFLLKDNNIDEYFVLGLWNIKDRGNVVFNMPKQEKQNVAAEQMQLMYEDFVIGLKKLNQLGYLHPDLANSHTHNSPQNLITTEKGIRAIDLDSGFYPYQDRANAKVAGKDQWLYVYNYKFPPDNKKRNQWRETIDKWYTNNPGKALTDYPEVLLGFHNQGKITLPPRMVHEMRIQHSDIEVSEYLSGRRESRAHTFHEVSPDDFQSPSFKKQYQSIKGDALKRTILRELKYSLDQMDNLEELQQLKHQFLRSPEMQILDKAQGQWTSRFHLKTDSHKAVERMFASAEKRIKEEIHTHLESSKGKTGSP